MNPAAEKYKCPFVCPGGSSGLDASSKGPKDIDMVQSGDDHSRNYARAYIPGEVTPYMPPKKISDNPPPYLPQPSDSSSGDNLFMGPIGPWAAGHIDWSPQAGMTGVRPVVDKYSITHYSAGEWRKNNKRMLTDKIAPKIDELDRAAIGDIKGGIANISEKEKNATKMLKDKVKLLRSGLKDALNTVNAITNEIELLEEYRSKLKSASRILMLPEAIAKECLEIRTHRLEPDLIRDDSEQELIKEVAIVGEIRRKFSETLREVETQLAENKAAKAAIESYWSDKTVTLDLDWKNYSYNSDSTLILTHFGVARWPENSISLEYWKHLCSEMLRNCEEVRMKSSRLRDDLMNIIIKGSQDMETQCNRTNAVLTESNIVNEELCVALEDTLKKTLDNIAKVENLIDNLNEQQRILDAEGKVTMTRLKTRNYNRPNTENCRDEAQYALMDAHKAFVETRDKFRLRMREADMLRAELMKYRGTLELDIACKRKSILINKERCERIRAHMPKPEEFKAC